MSRMLILLLAATFAAAPALAQTQLERATKGAQKDPKADAKKPLAKKAPTKKKSKLSEGIEKKQQKK